jgi:hypothetical protein
MAARSLQTYVANGVKEVHFGEKIERGSSKKQRRKLG